MAPNTRQQQRGKHLRTGRFPRFAFLKTVRLLFCAVLLAGLFTSCATKGTLTAKDYRALARAGITLGVDIDFDDDHQLFLEAAKWVGTPYRLGGNSKRGVDCSGLTRQLYKKVYHRRIPRTTTEQYDEKRGSVRRPSQLRQGDLVFFHPAGRKKTCNHVGIFLKDGKFIHASSSRGVIVDRLESNYWKKRWLSGGRKD